MSIQRLHTTPPESFTSPPLTPPPTDEKCRLSALPILEEIKNRKAGNTSIRCWSEYTLEPEGYNDLLQRLQGDGDKSLWGFVRYKLRYDYFPSTSRFILRMPTPIHESVIKSVTEELQHQLRSISSGDGQSAEFAKEVESDGSATIDFEESQFGSHDPDGQFRHSEANYPGVVLEVAYSQKAKDLPYLADEYILGSDGDIRAAIGINLEYKETKATLSIWEPRIVRNTVGEDELVAVQVVADQSFRDEKGNPNESANIDLQLQHFATKAFAQTHGPLQEPISISAQMLCEFLDRAVKRAVVRQEKTGWSRHSKPWVRKTASGENAR
ncbi:hypothetical protein BDZ45DRAFT_497209 [Acephala macrosclerotiorum]|nr:hypothetical protein BDZ45DRAFT_497209 [Acephala macrosclerotiorum]